MAIPRYTGRVADWIMNEEAPEAFADAITTMALLTIARLVFFIAFQINIAPIALRVTFLFNMESSI